VDVWLRLPRSRPERGFFLWGGDRRTALPPQFDASISKRGKGDMLALTTFLIVLMLAFGLAACIVAASLMLLMATVALTVAAIRQSVRMAVKALDASIAWIGTGTDRALQRLRA
jgi:hypothetical protein